MRHFSNLGLGAIFASSLALFGCDKKKDCENGAIYKTSSEVEADATQEYWCHFHGNSTSGHCYGTEDGKAYVIEFR